MWRNRPTNFNGTITRLVKDHVRTVAIDALAQNIQRSPVDTGRYRNNHTIGVNAVDGSTNRAPDPSGGGSSAEQGKLSNLPDFPTVFISNGLPYAQPIEDGISTTQAPSGVFRPTFSFISERYRRVTL